MIDHNVVRFHIAVHNALAVTEIQSFQELENVVADIEVVELGVKAAEVGVVDVFENKGRRLALYHFAIRNGILIRSLDLLQAVQYFGLQIDAKDVRRSCSHLRISNHVQ